MYTRTDGTTDENYDLCVVAVALISCGKPADDKIAVRRPRVGWRNAAFVEATDAWGLLEIDPRGIRISAVDYDDGWVDGGTLRQH